jgi:hypothetical protein
MDDMKEDKRTEGKEVGSRRREYPISLYPTRPLLLMLIRVKSSCSCFIIDHLSSISDYPPSSSPIFLHHNQIIIIHFSFFTFLPYQLAADKEKAGKSGKTTTGTYYSPRGFRASISAWSFAPQTSASFILQNNSSPPPPLPNPNSTTLHPHVHSPENNKPLLSSLFLPSFFFLAVGHSPFLSLKAISISTKVLDEGTERPSSQLASPSHHQHHS